MDVLQAPQDLVQEVTDMVVAQVLRLEKLIKICFHQGLYYIAVSRGGVKGIKPLP